MFFWKMQVQEETVIDGESGYIYQGGKVDDLIERIELFLALENSEREMMGILGRKYISSHFSRNIVIEEYMSEINLLSR